MKTGRRLFAGCAICAAIGGAMGVRGAAAQTATARRTILQSSDVPGTDRVTHLVLLEMPPGGINARHTHPGVTIGMVLDGELEVAMVGREPQLLKPGETVLIPTAVPHSERAGPSGCRAAVSFTLEKGKPLASPAPE